MSDLVARLHAALDEDERVAREAARRDGPRWLPNDFGAWLSSKMGHVMIAEEYGPGQPVIDHIARHDPARVLRQVKAMRKILEGVERYLDPHPGVPCTNIDEYGECTNESCDLHVAAKGRISPEVLPLLAEACGVEVEGL